MLLHRRVLFITVRQVEATQLGALNFPPKQYSSNSSSANASLKRNLGLSGRSDRSASFILRPQVTKDTARIALGHFRKCRALKMNVGVRRRMNPLDAAPANERKLVDAGPHMQHNSCKYDV